jgi:hypothetical protein
VVVVAEAARAARVAAERVAAAAGRAAK